MTPSSPFLQFVQPNTAIDLTNVDLVHQYASVGATSNKDDNLIQLCITAASYEWIWRTGRGPEGVEPSVSPFISPVQYDELYDGNGSYIQFLRNWPIVSVVSLTINGVTVSASSGYGSSGYAIYQGAKALFIRTGGHQRMQGRARGGFNEGAQNVEVVYTAGYSQVPAQIIKACTHMVAVNYKRTGWLDQSSKTIGAQGVTGTNSYRSWEVPPEVARTMKSFTRDWVV